MFPLKYCWFWLRKWFLSLTCPCRFFSQGFILFLIPLCLSASFTFWKEKKVFSGFCFFHGLSSKGYKVWCPLGSPPRWAAWARQGLALLPSTFYYELQQHLLLHLSHSTEFLLFSLHHLFWIEGDRKNCRVKEINAQMSFRQLQILGSQVDADGVQMGPRAGFFWILPREKQVCRKAKGSVHFPEPQGWGDAGNRQVYSSHCAPEAAFGFWWSCCLPSFTESWGQLWRTLQ